MNADTLMTMFSWIGIFVVGCGAIMLAYCAFDTIRDVVRVWRWKYTYKHRFDKPPTAACYCKDCAYHGTKHENSNPCALPGSDRWTPANGFCYEAKPRKYNEDAKYGT